jgi:pimeloyl-ACP methyl ester carboxylesterase
VRDLCSPLKCAILLASSVLLLSACQAPQSAPLPTPASAPAASPTRRAIVEQVNFTTEDHIKLAGTLYGLGEPDMAVVLAHQFSPGADQRTWQPFARLIAERGFTALTFDFRGIGQSEGPLREDLLYYDMWAAIDFLKSRGFKRIVCMGASMGGTTCLKAAVDRQMAGLAIISSPMSAYGSNGVTPGDLVRFTMPKLFICAQDDVVGAGHYRMVDSVNSLYKLSPEPKAIRIFPGTAHGTNLFDTESGNEFRDLLMKFLEGLR